MVDVKDAEVSAVSNNLSRNAWLDAVVRRSDRDLKRYLTLRIGNHVEAQDIAQEIYLRLLRLDNTDMIRSPEAFLFRLASNAVYEWRMRARNRLPHSPDELDGLSAEGEASDSIWREQLAGELTSALQRLPPKTRAAVLLHRREGLTYREVGLRLGVSGETVKKYLIRGVESCREQLRQRLGNS